MNTVIVVIGAGSIGQAIARRVSAGRHVLLAYLRQENADAAAKVLGDAGFEVSTKIVDVSSRESVHALVETAMGDITGVINAAGVSPTQASPALARGFPAWLIRCSSKRVGSVTSAALLTSARTRARKTGVSYGATTLKSSKYVAESACVIMPTLPSG